MSARARCATSAIAESAGATKPSPCSPEADVLAVDDKLNLTAPALGDALDVVGTVVKAGRTLTVCQLEVFAITRRPAQAAIARDCPPDQGSWAPAERQAVSGNFTPVLAWQR